MNDKTKKLYYSYVVVEQDSTSRDVFEKHALFPLKGPDAVQVWDLANGQDGANGYKFAYLNDYRTSILQTDGELDDQLVKAVYDLTCAIAFVNNTNLSDTVNSLIESLQKLDLK